MLIRTFLCRTNDAFPQEIHQPCTRKPLSWRQKIQYSWRFEIQVNDYNFSPSTCQKKGSVNKRSSTTNPP